MTGLIIVEIAITAVVSLLFALIYGLKSNWRSSAIGQHLMWFAVITGMECLALALLAMGLPVPLWVFTLVYGALAAVGIQRLYLLLRVQNGSAS